MCEFCKNEYPLRQSACFPTKDCAIATHLLVKGDMFIERTIVYDYKPDRKKDKVIQDSPIFKICYCPMCGRDLRGKSENE